MRRHLRRFAAVSAVVTVVDVAVLVALVRVASVPVPAADAAAIAVAALASWTVHRAVARHDDPFGRWSRRPAAFTVTTVATGAVDVAMTTALVGFEVDAAGALLGAKAVALLVAGTLRALAYRLVQLDDVRARLSRRVPRPPAPGELRFTVVVPAYREARRIGRTVRTIRAELADLDADGGVEVVVVDDGSGDGTGEEAALAGARVVELPENRGKGAAVRAGVLAARGRTVAFVDADLAYPPRQLVDLLAEVEAGWDVVVGSRRHPGSSRQAELSRLRALSGTLFNVLTVVVLLGQYRDTQCGCKAFRSDVARVLFGHTRIDRFAFDVEVLHLVERYGFSLTEVPVTLVTALGSTVRVGVDALAMLGDLVRVRRWAGQGRYDLRPGERLPGQEVPRPGD